MTFEDYVRKHLDRANLSHKGIDLVRVGWNARGEYGDRPEGGEAVAMIRATGGIDEKWVNIDWLDVSGLKRGDKLYVRSSASLPEQSKPVACVTDLGLGNGDRVVQWHVDPLPDGTLLYAAPVPVITQAMIDAGAQRLVSWEDNCTWPDSWGPMTVAAARQDAERVIRSALSAARESK